MNMRQSTKSRVVLTAGIAMFAFLLAVPASAANLNVIPGVSITETWDSNIFNAPSNEESDFIFRAAPRLTLVIQAFHTSASITGGFEIESYADHNELNETVATQNYNLAVPEPFRITPRFSLRPLASYLETRDSVRRNELAQAPTPELPTTESVITERRKLREYRAGLQMGYLLSPNMNLSVGGGVTKREFPEDVTGTGLEDSRSITGDITLSYQLTPRYFQGVFFNTSYNTFSESPDSKTYTGGLTGRYLLSQQYALGARAGATYLKESADNTGQTHDSWSPYGSLSLSYAWQNFRAVLEGSYEVDGGGSFGTTSKRGTISLTFGDQFAQRWWWDLTGLYQNNKYTEIAIGDINTIQGVAGIRYAVFEWASVRLGGTIVRQQSNGPGGNDLDRESIFLGIDMSKPYQVY
jgi:hypothetical protein